MKLNTIPSQEVYPFKLPALPYEKNSLEPFISEEAINYHYGKHHQTYIDNLNTIIKEKGLDNKTLEELIIMSSKDPAQVGVFNNAAQIWNHTFYWHCMKPKGGAKPERELLDKLNKAFGSLENFIAEFKQAAIAQFGSGWAWLVHDGNNLKIMKTANADLPMNHNCKALLTVDVWEHAYYIDYKNKRADYINTFFEELINWDFVNNNLQY